MSSFQNQGMLKGKMNTGKGGSKNSQNVIETEDKKIMKSRNKVLRK